MSEPKMLILAPNRDERAMTIAAKAQGKTVVAGVPLQSNAKAIAKMAQIRRPVKVLRPEIMRFLNLGFLLE